MALLPECFLIATLLILLFQTLAVKTNETLLQGIGALGAFAACLASLLTLNEKGLTFWGSYRIDLLSQIFKGLLSLSLFHVILFSKSNRVIPSFKRAEYHLFLLSASLGMMMLTSAVELLTFYLSLELSAYSLYLLVPLKEHRWNSEAGMKYLLFGAATSGFLLYGFSLLLGISQTTSLEAIALKAPALSQEPVFLLALFLISAAFFFKLSLVPFHFWAPDAYEAAAMPVTLFIATASKSIGVAILLRWLSLLGVPGALIGVLAFISLLSMTAGNAVALVQKDMKRLLAYSSIAQAGYILVGLLSASPDAMSAVCFYAIAYLWMNLGAFLVTWWVGQDRGTDNPSLTDFNGLAERSPLLALVLLISLLSLAGIPPLMGFTGKWFLFTAAMKQGHWFLVLAGVVNSVISLFYYLVIVKHAYLYPAAIPKPMSVALPARWVSLAIFLILVLFGVFPKSILQVAEAAFPLL